jgi:hypothetical protein
MAPPVPVELLKVASDARNQRDEFLQKKNISNMIKVMNKYTEILETYNRLTKISRQNLWLFRKSDEPWKSGSGN